LVFSSSPHYTEVSPKPRSRLSVLVLFFSEPVRIHSPLRFLEYYPRRLRRLLSRPRTYPFTFRFPTFVFVRQKLRQPLLEVLLFSTSLTSHLLPYRPIYSGPILPWGLPARFPLSRASFPTAGGFNPRRTSGLVTALFSPFIFSSARPRTAQKGNCFRLSQRLAFFFFPERRQVIFSFLTQPRFSLSYFARSFSAFRESCDCLLNEEDLFFPPTLSLFSLCRHPLFTPWPTTFSLALSTQVFFFR